MLTIGELGSVTATMWRHWKRWLGVVTRENVPAAQTWGGQSTFQRPLKWTLGVNTAIGTFIDVNRKLPKKLQKVSRLNGYGFGKPWLGIKAII